MKPITISLLILFSCHLAMGQTDEIKKKSTENAGNRSSGRSEGSTSGGGGGWFFFNSFKLLATWQAMKLEKAQENKRLVSLETYFQGAVQPSNYYLFHPRIRGNWGLFSSDFRYNYLVEESKGSGSGDLSTFDWQILQLNLVTTKNVTGRIGFGNMVENYGARQTFFEWTAGLSIIPNNQKLGGSLEYRVAKDYNTNAIPRREVNFFLEKQVFSTGALHGALTLGGVYQRYYESVSVWGMQAGLVMRIY
jgi:hypothetical protein